MDLKYDGLISIATGRSRKETLWKNKDMLWSKFMQRISKTKRTAETYAEYMQLPKARQDEIKDVGGFVGGTLKEGRRRKGHVESRSIITLDADYDQDELIAALEAFYTFAYAVYSTHKHGPDKRRYRLVIPLKRKVKPDEYTAIGRKLAHDINIEIFDDTTYEPERLMYWPSTSSDGEFEFYYNDGEWLDPDEILGQYENWKDMSSWPVSSRVGEVIKNEAKKQENPMTKEGTIGAFCRAYSIADAITTFLSDVYTAAQSGRYSYVHGSTVGGLVLYGEYFSYSHHSTDPAAGKLCNAFDLVRIHKYGNLDEGSRSNTAVHRLPSFKAMIKLAASDEKVRKVIGDERFEQAQKDFGGTLEKQEDSSFRGRISYKENGKAEQTIENVVIVLENDINLKGKLAYNSFSGRLDIRANLPWRKVEGIEHWRDADDANMRHYLEKQYGLSDRKKIEDGIMVVARRNEFHPVREYLNGLEWDKKERVDRLFIDYLGAENTAYVRAVSRKILIGAVARIYSPGIKFDAMLTVQGPQGIGKSTLIRKIAKSWFSDSLIDVNSKDSFMQLSGHWLLEIAELNAMKRAEAAAMKHFVSKTEDDFRPPFGKHTETFPRQCIFFGTTNEAQFLRDQTGARRYWVVEAGIVKVKKDVFGDLTEKEVDQIWAEAKILWEKGESLILPPELEEEAKILQEAYTEDDPRIGMIGEYLEIELPEKWYNMDIWERRNYMNESFKPRSEKSFMRTRVCVMEIWEELFAGDAKTINRFQINDLHEIITKIPGWKRFKNKKKFKNYGVQRGYYRIGSEDDESLVESLYKQENIAEQLP